MRDKERPCRCRFVSGDGDNATEGRIFLARGLLAPKAARVPYRGALELVDQKIGAEVHSAPVRRLLQRVLGVGEGAPEAIAYNLGQW